MVYTGVYITHAKAYSGTYHRTNGAPNVYFYIVFDFRGRQYAWTLGNRERALQAAREDGVLA